MMASLVKALVFVASGVIGGLVSRLPDSPFVVAENPMLTDWGAVVGYFFPVGAAVSHTALFLVASGVWFGLRWLFRVFRAVQ